MKLILSKEIIKSLIYLSNLKRKLGKPLRDIKTKIWMSKLN